MNRNFISLLVAVVVAGTLRAEEPAKSANPAEGALMIRDKDYPLTHALAYETTINDEEMIAVVLSGRAVTSEEIENARGRDKRGNEPLFQPPFLRLEFSKSGELKQWSGSAGDSSLGRRSGEATGELKVQDGRATGKASQPNRQEMLFTAGFDVRFDAPLLKAGESLPATVVKKPGPAANVKPSVTGTFKGNGKEAKLAYVSARWREPFDDKQSIMLIFTEKDHSKAKRPDFDAGFGKFGSALVISLFADGSIFGCEVAHSAHEKQGFSSVGRIETKNFEFAEGKVTGELTTQGEIESLGEKWEVELKFVAPLGEIPEAYQMKEAKTNAATPTPGEDAPEETRAAEPAADQLNVKDLALTRDASDFEYKELVGHVLFKSKSSVKSVCTELAANLKAQGWKTEGRDLITANSSILKRKRGAASLTIFVKPEGGGSEVKMFTEGLSWD